MLAIAVVALTAIVVLPCAAQVKHKAAPVSDPLSSFKLAVGRFNTFFAAGPRKMIVAEPFHRSVSGRVVTIYQILPRTSLMTLRRQIPSYRHT
jgi:hypothetical protein